MFTVRPYRSRTKFALKLSAVAEIIVHRTLIAEANARQQEKEREKKLKAKIKPVRRRK